MHSEARIDQIERYIRRDPAHRGLLSGGIIEDVFPLGELSSAARSLVERRGRVGIVTGFFIPRADPPAAESDGPLGAVPLAVILSELGFEVELFTDPLCHPLLMGVARLHGVPESLVKSLSDPQIEELLYSTSETDFTHLIAIERVGPSHSLSSFLAQSRSVEPPVAEFLRVVPEASWNRCHNMRGELIDASAGQIHRLFEILPQRYPHLRTIGIGDGGNEIGMGKILWEVLASRLPRTTPPQSICRIATTWNLIAGTSNWGAFALAAAVALLQNRLDLLRKFDVQQQHSVLTHMANERIAVDGVTREFQPTVDGLPFLTYVQPWEAICHTLGLR